MNELEELYALRETINARIARLEQREAFPVYRNGGGLGVLTQDIRPYVQSWIDEGHTLQSLADKADISAETLYKIMRLERPTVRESTVDKILQALGLPHVFHDLVPEPPEGQYYEE